MKTNNRTAIVSTVGTSVLTDRSGEMTNLLRETANHRTNEYSYEDLKSVKNHIENKKIAMMAMDPIGVRRNSAELNGILGLEADGSHLEHFLLCTDTFQGAESAKIVESRLRQDGSRSTNIQKLEGLTTKNREDFSRGIDSLLNWCDLTLPELKRQGFHIVFNLVGGFKSMNAYAQTIGMVYADEITYIFEGASSELIRIPKLPISFDTKALERNASAVIRMAVGNETLSKHEVADLPEAYLEIHSEELVALSAWGKLAWNRVKDSVLVINLLELPGIDFTDSFRRDFDACNHVGMKRFLQETLAKVSVLWRRGGLKELRTDGGILYEVYSNRGNVGHFRINQGDRVSCEPIGDRLVLRHFGLHDVVNKNP